MLYDGFKLAEGSGIQNLVVESGTAFPTAQPDVGELYYRTDAGNIGLFVFNGTTWDKLDESIPELPDIVAAGTYRSVAVDTKGRVTAGTNPTTLAGYGITDAQPLDDDLVAIAGLSGSTGFLKKTASNTWTLDTAPSQTITVSGDATGSGTTALTLTLANSGVTTGTYKSVTVDAKGRVTAGTNPTTLAGYGITDATPASHVGSGDSAHALASLTAAGFMSAADKTKLDGINIIGGNTINWTPISNNTTVSAGTSYLATSLGPDPAVRALLPLTGANGSTTVTDLTGRTWTAVGNSQVSTAQSKFGGGAFRFDGNADYLATSTTAQDSIATGNFTIEMWVYWNTLTGTKKYATCANSTSAYWTFQHDAAQGPSLYVSGYIPIVNQGNNSGWSTGVWYHVALVRNGNVFTIYRNGQAVATATNSANIGHFGTLTVGGTQVDLAGSADAWFNDFRYIPGVARYTANFIPPSAPLSLVTTNVDITLPTTINAGDTFRIRNSATNAENSTVSVISGSRRIRPFTLGENLIADIGEELSFVATSNTELELIVPQFDPRDTPISTKNQSFTFGIVNRGETCIKTDSNAYSWTIAPDATTNFPIGTNISLLNDSSAGNVTVTPGGGVTLLDGATAGAFTLLPNVAKKLTKVGANRWRIS